MPESGSPGKRGGATQLCVGRLFEFGDLVSADLVDDAAEFFDARAKPSQFLFANPVLT